VEDFYGAYQRVAFHSNLTTGGGTVSPRCLLGNKASLPRQPPRRTVGNCACTSRHAPRPFFCFSFPFVSAFSFFFCVNFLFCSFCSEACGHWHIVIINSNYFRGIRWFVRCCCNSPKRRRKISWAQMLLYTVSDMAGFVITNVLGSNSALGMCYPDWYVSWFYSVSP
jgi:hypothetical protein